MNDNVNPAPDADSEGDDEHDERDAAVVSADDTGMLAQQQLIAEEEVLLGTEGEEPGKTLP